MKKIFFFLIEVYFYFYMDSSSGAASGRRQIRTTSNLRLQQQTVADTKTPHSELRLFFKCPKVAEKQQKTSYKKELYSE